MKLLRGRVVIRELVEESKAGLWQPPPNPRETKTHRGVVLGLGPPMIHEASKTEVPHGFGVGDVVQYHFSILQELSTNIWEDGKPAHWIPQQDVDGVWESDDEKS